MAPTLRPQRVGEPASDSLRAALADDSSGWFQGSTAKSGPVYTSFNRSTFIGWTDAVGIPVADVEVSLRRSLAYLIALGVGLLCRASP